MLQKIISSARCKNQKVMFARWVSLGVHVAVVCVLCFRSFSNDAIGSFAFTPVAAVTGQATITVTVDDEQYMQGNSRIVQTGKQEFGA